VAHNITEIERERESWEMRCATSCAIRITGKLASHSIHWQCQQASPSSSLTIYWSLNQPQLCHPLKLRSEKKLIRLILNRRLSSKAMLHTSLTRQHGCWIGTCLHISQQIIINVHSLSLSLPPSDPLMSMNMILDNDELNCLIAL